MKKIILVIIVIIGVGYWFKYQANKKNLQKILPEKTVFFIDPELSKSIQCKIIHEMEKSYILSKDPQQVMEQSSAKFPEIESMKVQICQSDKICFYVEVSAPLCLLNEKLIICDNGSLVDKDHFDIKIIDNLVSVILKDMNQINDLVVFIKHLPDIFKKEFAIEFRSNHEIFLIDKNNKNFAIEASVRVVPTVQDLTACQKIVQELALKPKFKKKSLICDVRFKNQIIVR